MTRRKKSDEEEQAAEVVEEILQEHIPEELAANEELVAAAMPKETFDAIKLALEQALPIAEYLARLTATLWDDKVVECMRAFLDSDALIGWLERIIVTEAVVASSGISRTTFVLNAAADTATQEIRAAAAEAGIPWDQVLANLPQIIALVLTLMGKRR